MANTVNKKSYSKLEISVTSDNIFWLSKHFLINLSTFHNAQQTKVFFTILIQYIFTIF